MGGRLLVASIFLAGLLFVAFAFSGCSSTAVRDSAFLAGEARLVDLNIQGGAVERVALVSLSAAELAALGSALDGYNAFRGKWQAAVNASPEMIPERVLMLSADYSGLVRHYDDIRTIVLAHWAEYSPGQQLEFQGYAAQAERIHALALGLLEQQRQNESLTMMLQYGLIIAKIAAAA